MCPAALLFHPFAMRAVYSSWDVILHDIRKAHENDMESAPDTTPADELIKEVRKAMQSTGDRVQEFLEIFCKAFQLKYMRLTDEVIIPGLFEPPVRTLRATIPENESHIFR